MWDCLKQRFVRNDGSREVPSAKAACRDLHGQNTLSKSPPELFQHLDQTLCDRLVSCDLCDMVQYGNIPPSQCSQAFAACTARDSSATAETPKAESLVRSAVIARAAKEESVVPPLQHATRFRGCSSHGVHYYSHSHSACQPSSLSQHS